MRLTRGLLHMVNSTDEELSLNTNMWLFKVSRQLNGGDAVHIFVWLCGISNDVFLLCTYVLLM